MEREAILAAMKSVAKQAASIQGSAQEVSAQSDPFGVSRSAGPEGSKSFASQMGESLKSIDGKAKGIESLHEDVITGKVGSIHEAVIQMKQAEFSLRFAMEIRNKLVDAYREVMRMNV